MAELSTAPDKNKNGGGNPVVTWVRANPEKIIALVFWLLIIGGVIYYYQTSGFESPTALGADLADRLSEFIAGTWYGPLIYIFIYFLRPVILFPASILTILAGNLYGLWMGMVWGLIAGTTSSIIPFYAGKWFFAGRNDEEGEADGEESRLQKFAGVLRDNPFETVLTMRLLFLPYDPVSIFAGSLGVPFWKFFVATLMGNVVGSIPYIALGASVQGNPFTAEVEFNPWIFVLAITTLVLSIGFSQLYKRLKAKDEETAVEAA
ncbi:MAG: VTT domain-containing protein [Chloroflexota bacterium]